MPNSSLMPPNPSNPPRAALPDASHTSSSLSPPTNPNDPGSGSAGQSTVTTPPNSVSQRQDAAASANRAAVAVACVGCRSRHLKCDGAPRCGRCVSEGLPCSYVKSRRGWKGPRRPLVGQGTGLLSGSGGGAQQLFNNHSAVQRPSVISPTMDTSFLSPAGLPQESLVISQSNNSLAPLDFMNGGLDVRNQLALAPNAAHELPVDSSANGLINAFYVYFHPAHPFLLPYPQMIQHLDRFSHLALAMQYVGSFYVPVAPTNSYEEALQQRLMQMSQSRDGTVVQAMLLYSIGLHIRNKEEESATAMYAAINMAQDLGMSQRGYASSSGGNGTRLEESLRRTWWELFVVDGMYAGVNPGYVLQLHVAPMNLPLPCEDVDYASGFMVPNPRTLTDYDDSLFVDDDNTPSFSSGAYRIDAVRLLRGVLAATGPGSNHLNPNLMDEADTHLTNFSLHLPSAKRKPIDRDGQVDEVLFEAIMIVSACSILLHRPRSDLSFEDVKDVTTCVAGGKTPLPGNYKDLHTAKAMAAARDICDLIKLPCPLVKHTPFFTCAVTMSAVVYLSYWSFIATESYDATVKDYIRLNIGVLKTLATIMPIARTVLAQVKGVAQELFASRKALNNQYWSAVTREEILQDMIEDAATAAAATATAGSQAAVGAVAGGQVDLFKDFAISSAEM